MYPQEMSIALSDPGNSNHQQSLPKKRRKRVSKYMEYDEILGSSTALTRTIKENRWKRFKMTSVRSISHLQTYLNKVKESDGMICQFLAGIPFPEVGLTGDSDNAKILEVVRRFLDMVNDIIGLRFVSVDTEKSEEFHTYNNLQYKCNQDIGTVRADRPTFKPSAIKKFNCRSNLTFRIFKKYNFIEINFNHSLTHSVKRTKSTIRTTTTQ